jgi:hypothetical protein
MARLPLGNYARRGESTQLPTVCTIMGPIALAVLLFLTRSALAETGLSRQIVATDQGGGAYRSRLYDPESNFNKAEGTSHETKDLVTSSIYRCAFSRRHTASASG